MLRRRDFLSAAGSSALIAVCSGSAGTEPLVTPARGGTSGIVDVGSEKQLFLDDLLLHERSRISKFVYRPDKNPRNPILVADRPWEQATDAGIQLDTQATLYDAEEKLFKMWYSAPVWSDQRAPWCYAVSRDGFVWEKPELGLFEFRGSKRNNLVGAWDQKIGLTYSNVIKTPHDPDPARRYKAMGELENGPVANRDGGVSVAFSPDGLRWTSFAGNPVIRHGPNLADAPTMFGWDERRRKYLAYPRPGHPLAREINGAGIHRHIRTIGFAESDDFIRWSPTQVMLAPDEDDRADFQFGQFTAGRCAGFYVGFLMVHQTHEQTWGVYLLSSRDGFHWNWVDRHTPFMVRGEVGAYDAGYQSMSGPITRNGRHFLYYGAFRGAHSEKPSRLGKSRVTIAMATLPEDRWLGLLAGPDEGTLITRPLFFKGSRLFFDLDASLPQGGTNRVRDFDSCELRAELLDQSGSRIEEFSLERCAPLLESGRQEIRWAGADLARLVGKPVRIRFKLRACALYSFQFA
jgi:hypothetical protein